METSLYSVDVAIFRWINQGWSRPSLDAFFSFVTDYKNFIPLLAAWLIYLLAKEGNKGRFFGLGLVLSLLSILAPLFLFVLVPWFIYLLVKADRNRRFFVLGFFACILIADQSSSHLVKPLVERLRPCNVLPDVLTPVGKSASYSFPSSHGSNMGAILFLIAATYGRWAWFFVPFALASGLSRIYLGLHYPSDVAAGYLFGALVGFGVWWGIEKAKENFKFSILNSKFWEAKALKKTPGKSGKKRD